MQKLFRKYFFVCFLALVFILAVTLRLWQLGKIPSSMSDDEVRLTYTAWSIWKTGKDLNGIFLPLSFVMSDYAFNPVPIYLTAPVVGIFGLSMTTARLPFAIAGILTVILVYSLAWTLFKDRWQAALAGAVLAVNAWHLQLSRFAYEGTIALFFYVLGTFLVIRSTKKNIWIYIAGLTSFILGFYSYSGYKITLVPILLGLFVYKRKEFTRTHAALTVAAIFLAFSSLWFLGKTQSALHYGGGNLFFFSDMSAVEKQVELERRASGAPEWLRKLYHNKATVLWRTFIEQYQYAFSPQYLFTDQEGSGIFSVWFRGEFYYFESILLLFGVLYLFIKKRRELVLLFFLLGVAALPAGLGPGPITYTIRSSFMLPWLAIFIGAGVASLGYFITQQNIKRMAFGIVVVVYAYYVGGYLTQYYFEWMRYGAKYYAKADADLAQFLLSEKDKRGEISVGDVQPMTFLHYAFYAKLPPQAVQGIYNQYTIHVDNVTFADKCLDFAKQNPTKAGPPGSLIILAHQCVEGQNNKLFKPSTVISSVENDLEWYVFEQQ